MTLGRSLAGSVIGEALTGSRPDNRADRFLYLRSMGGCPCRKPLADKLPALRTQSRGKQCPQPAPPIENAYSPNRSVPVADGPRGHGTAGVPVSEGFCQQLLRLAASRAKPTCPRECAPIREIHEDSRGGDLSATDARGYAQQGRETVGLNCVARLMGAERIQGWPRRKRRDSGRVANGRPAGVKSLLECDFTAQEPERKWSRTSRK